MPPMVGCGVYFVPTSPMVSCIAAKVYGTSQSKAHIRRKDAMVKYIQESGYRRKKSSGQV